VSRDARAGTGWLSKAIEPAKLALITLRESENNSVEYAGD
jgi:hypothetical protein